MNAARFEAVAPGLTGAEPDWTDLHPYDQQLLLSVGYPAPAAPERPAPLQILKGNADLEAML